MSLRVRFAMAMAALVIGVSGLLAWIASDRATEEIRHRIGQSVADTARYTADALDRGMAARVAEIRLLADMPALLGGDQKQIRGHLERLQATYDVVSWIGFMNPQGRVVAATGGILEGEDIHHRPIFEEGRRGLWVGDVHETILLAHVLPRGGDEPDQFVDVAAPVLRADGGLAGVLGAHLSWDWAQKVQRSLSDALDVQRGEQVFVIAADGIVLLGPEGTVGTKVRSLKPWHQAFSGDAGWSVARWPDGADYVTGRAFADGEGAFPGLAWSVLVRQSSDAAFAPARALRADILTVGAALAVLFAGLGWLVAGGLSAPLLRLADAADRIRDESGGPDDIPLVTGVSELTRLSTSLRGMLRHILAQSHTIARLEDVVHTDPLTGLPNRAFLDEYMVHALGEAERDRRAVAVMFLDLDGFKQVNDGLGHHAGDLLLIEVSDRLRECLRAGDVAVRLGGDEFVLVCKVDPHDATVLARTIGDRIIAALSQPVDLPGSGTARISCSVGVALWPQDGQDGQVLLRHADAALYAAKAAGKGRVEVHKGAFGGAPPG